MITLEKTLPAGELHMGAVIRAALTRAGVSHRVGASGTGARWLATTGHEGPTVYITARTRTGQMGYDIGRGAFIGINAVVTDDDGTWLVYHGTNPAKSLAPEADAAECARTVAARLGIAPYCAACDDTGVHDLYDASTDAVTGSRACDGPGCAARQIRLRAEGDLRAARAAATAEAHERGCTGADCCAPF